MRSIHLLILSCFLLCFSSCKSEEVEQGYSVSFDTRGGTPAVETIRVNPGATVAEPAAPSKGDSIFAGWFDVASNAKFNFKSTINSDVKLYAKWWLSPQQYIVFSSSDSRYNYETIKQYFGSQVGKNVAVAVAPLFRIFQRDITVFETAMREHLRQSLLYEIPIFFFLSVTPFNEARPDLWNWWDSSAPGYNPDNINNVEWYDWTSASAVKIGWLNWGKQMRLPPMLNQMSPKVQQEEKIAVTRIMTLVKEWYDALPANKKYLFAGIRSTDEMAVGINNWYYPNGNSYVGKPESGDPTTGINPLVLPSRGVQTIGFNAVKTAGIKTSGTLTIEDLNEVCRRHGEFMSKIYFDMGFPREKIFCSSFAKTLGEAKTCINDYSCPSWSFYHAEAVTPNLFSSAMDALKLSTAPAWGMAEWGIPWENLDITKCKTALQTGLAIPKNKLIRLTGSNVVSDAGVVNLALIDAVKQVNK